MKENEYSIGVTMLSVKIKNKLDLSQVTEQKTTTNKNEFDRRREDYDAVASLYHEKSHSFNTHLVGSDGDVSQMLRTEFGKAGVRMSVFQI